MADVDSAQERALPRYASASDAEHQRTYWRDAVQRLRRARYSVIETNREYHDETSRDIELTDVLPRRRCCYVTRQRCSLLMIDR